MRILESQVMLPKWTPENPPGCSGPAQWRGAPGRRTTRLVGETERCFHPSWLTGEFGCASYVFPHIASFLNGLFLPWKTECLSFPIDP